MKKVLPLVTLLVILVPATAEAQWRNEQGSAFTTYDAGEAYLVVLAQAPGTGDVRPVEFEPVLRGSTAGAVIAVAIGGVIGARVARDMEYVGGAGGALILGTVAAPFGTLLGSRQASGGRGNQWATAAGSFGGAAAGIGLGVLLGTATQSEVLGVAVALPILIGLPAWIETATAR